MCCLTTYLKYLPGNRLPLTLIAMEECPACKQNRPGDSALRQNESRGGVSGNNDEGTRTRVKHRRHHGKTTFHANMIVAVAKFPQWTWNLCVRDSFQCHLLTQNASHMSVVLFRIGHNHWTLGYSVSAIYMMVRWSATQQIWTTYVQWLAHRKSSCASCALLSSTLYDLI